MLLRGTVLVDDGELVAAPGIGRFVARARFGEELAGSGRAVASAAPASACGAPRAAQRVGPSARARDRSLVRGGSRRPSTSDATGERRTTATSFVPKE